MLETSPCEVLWEGPMDGRCHCCPLGIDLDQRTVCAKKPLPKVCQKDDRRQRTLRICIKGVRAASLHQLPWLTAWEASHLSQYPEGFSLFTSHNAARDCKLYLWPSSLSGSCCLMHWYFTIKTHELYCKIHCEAAVCVSYTVQWELLAGWPSV